MKKALLWMVLVITGLGFAGCDLFPDNTESIEILGTWVFADGYGGTETLSVTDSIITYSYSSTAYNTSLEYDLADFDNEGFNAGESGKGNSGYAVVQYPDDTYGVLRWKNLTDSSLDYAFAYKDATPDDESSSDGLYFATSAEAETKMTTADGFFNLFTQGAEKQ